MIGESNSFKSNVLLNPLVWVGVLLAFLHMRYKTDTDVWAVFQEAQTYINLFIGASVYTLVFDRHYTENRERLAIAENFFAIITNAYIIIFTWFMSVFAVTQYHEGGLRYSASLKEHIENQKDSTRAPAHPQAAPQLNNVNIESGKKYKFTPTTDGGFIVEVIDN